MAFTNTPLVHGQELADEREVLLDDIAQLVWVVHQVWDVVSSHMEHHQVSILWHQRGLTTDQPVQVIDPSSTDTVQVEDHLPMGSRQIFRLESAPGTHK